MTTIIAIFSLSLVISLILTPLAAKTATKCGLVDIPTHRKVHSDPIPHTGGVAIYISFYLSFVPIIFYRTEILDLLLQRSQIIYLIVGAGIVFGLGLWDDVRKIRPELKLGIQIVAALVAYMGGVCIKEVGLPGLPVWVLGWLSLPLTVFWILLVINAINLIDGLDGLAAGVSFFVCVVLLVLCIVSKRFLLAVVLAGLSGATLGFLKYNFNPAIIFLGDGGSYFLGYVLATLSILGSIKSQAAATILIPIIALGVPLMDIFWSTVRRFILGRKLFQADKDHIHHRLMKLGYSHQRAVLILYAATIGMGIIGIFLIHARNEQAALFLVIVGMFMIIGLRKLGYLSYFSRDRIIRWVGDISDEMGLSHDRRSFLGLQVEASKSKNLDELWFYITRAAQILEFDIATLYLYGDADKTGSKSPPASPNEGHGTDRWKIDSSAHSVCMHESSIELEWTNPSFDRRNGFNSRSLMKLELPLQINGDTCLGTLVLFKDIRIGSFGYNILRRVEHLRRTIISTLEKMDFHQ